MFFSKSFLVVALLGMLTIGAAAQGWRHNSINANGDLVAVYFTSSSKGFVAGDSGYLASTVDGGRSWQQYPLKTKEDINEIYFRNDKNGYIVAGRKMFITDDGGSSWAETTIAGADKVPEGLPVLLSIRFADRKRGIAIGSVLDRKGEVVIDSLVMRTDDGGSTWDRIKVPAKGELYHLDFHGSSMGWIVGDQGVILSTTDGGLNWSQQNSGTANDLYCIDFRDSKEGYAVGQAGTILRTENGGANWEKVSTAFPGTFMRVDFADDKNGWIVGHRGVILRSSDRGRTWVKMESSTTKNLYGLYMVKKYGWAVGSDGSIVEYLK